MAHRDLLMQSEMILSTKTRGARVRGTLSFFLVAILLLAAPTTEHANLIKSQEPNGCRHLDSGPPGRPLILSRCQYPFAPSTERM